ncbi:MAG: signal peptidase II [Pseudomonadota bacterium]
MANASTGTMHTVYWIAAAIFVFDQVTKLYVLHVIDLDVLRDYPIFPPFLQLQMAWNHGINFGLMASNAQWMRWVLIAVALGIAIWVAIWIRSESRPAARVAAGLLIGGAVGNVVDRIAYGAVADFLNMSCCGITNPYSFNVADIAIFAGAIGLILFTGERRNTA